MSPKLCQAHLHPTLAPCSQLFPMLLTRGFGSGGDLAEDSQLRQAEDTNLGIGISLLICETSPSPYFPPNHE